MSFTEKVMSTHQEMISWENSKATLLNAFDNLKADGFCLALPKRISYDSPNKEYKLYSDRIETALSVQYKIGDSEYSAWIEMIKLSFSKTALADDKDVVLSSQLPVVYQAIERVLIAMGFDIRVYRDSTDVYENENFIESVDYTQFYAVKKELNGVYIEFFTRI